jgi:hypothetical protein
VGATVRCSLCLVYSPCLGVVYFAHDPTGSRDVAIKVERGFERTANECAAFKALKGIPGIPDFIMIESQRFGLDHATLFIERLGSDLDVFMQDSGGFL